MANLDYTRLYDDHGALRALSSPIEFDRSADDAVVRACQQAIQTSQALLLRIPDAAVANQRATEADESGKDIFRLFYSSRVPRSRHSQQRRDDIDEIVRASRSENPRLGITGVLVANETMYSQVLEGPSRSIKDLIGRISCDVRHEDVRIISRDISDSRLFADWSMEFLLTDQDMEVRNDRLLTADGTATSAIVSFCTSVGIRTS